MTVQRNARRLHRLVDDLLSDAAQARQGRAAPRPDLAGQRGAHLGRRGGEGRARRTVSRSSLDAGRSLLEVSGDAERLAQVIDNIFNNAIKFTPAGGHVACRDPARR